MVRAFRFGASHSRAETATEWAELARRTEALGYSTFLVWERGVPQLGPIAALTAAALATRTLRVSSYVFVNDFHHPVVLAREAATIDLLSGGRFELGIGAGFVPAEYRAAGIPFETGAVRVARLEQAIAVIDRCFAGATFSYRGRHYDVEEHTGWPRPVQRPRPPLMLAGARPRLLTLAAREADIVGVAAGHDPTGRRTDQTAAATDEKVRLVRAAAGDRMRSPELQITLYETAARQIGDAVTRIARQTGLTEDEVRDSPHYLFGSTAQMVETLRERRERFGISYVVVNRPEDMERFAPVVKILAGT